MPIALANPEAYTVPPSSGFTPDRQGVRKLCVDVDPLTNKYRVNFTMCPANADAWGDTDLPDMSTADLAGEVFAAPDSAERTAALAALQAMVDATLTLAEFLITLRATPPA